MRKTKIAVWTPINNIVTDIRTFMAKPMYRLSMKNLKNKYKNINKTNSKNINLSNI